MDRIEAGAFLRTLQGKPLFTLTGRPNKILRVSGDSVVVATNKSPMGRPVPTEWVQAALDRLVTDGIVHINVESVGYRSAFIGAVLSEVPGAVAGSGSVRVANR